jgi:3-deoxy-D-manno-octulosonic acid (KDO) 8-phosphate synthase
LVLAAVGVGKQERLSVQAAQMPRAALIADQHQQQQLQIVAGVAAVLETPVLVATAVLE